MRIHEGIMATIYFVERDCCIIHWRFTQNTRTHKAATRYSLGGKRAPGTALDFRHISQLQRSISSCFQTVLYPWQMKAFWPLELLLSFSWWRHNPVKLEFKLNLYRIEYDVFPFTVKIELASKTAVVNKFNRTCSPIFGLCSCSSSHHLDTRCSRPCSACIHHIMVNSLSSYNCHQS